MSRPCVTAAAAATALTAMLLVTPASAACPHLDDMTWTELGDRIRSGATIVLIPIGGTEQKVGISPQHIVPSWDLRTRWLTNNAEGRTDGSLTPIDPRTTRPGEPIAVDDPYTLYFLPDGTSAIASPRPASGSISKTRKR